MRRLAVAFLLVFAAAAPAAAQSLFSSAGLGLPVTPLDARARALGGIGVGLSGYNLSLVNPAEVSGFVRRGAMAAFESADLGVDFQGQSGASGGTRFPLARVIYPIGERLTTSFGYGGILEQSWSVRSEGTETVGDVTVPTIDLVQANGGLSQLRIDAAYALAPRLSVGVAAGLYTGGLQRTSRREFPDTMDAFRDFEHVAEWSYTAPLAAVGARWDPLDIVRLAGSLTWSGTLHANAESGGVEDRSFSLPLQLAAGASVVLAPRLDATLGTRWAGWSAVADDVAAPARNTWEVGGGLEWEGIQAGGRVFPIRLGGRWAQLPFGIAGSEASEWSATFGLGALLTGDEWGPLATADAALERGGRSAGDALSEDYWRFVFSVAVFGR